MGVRAEHLVGIIRRLDSNERMLRVFVVDCLCDLIDEHISDAKAMEVHDYYMKGVLDQDIYIANEFKQLLNTTFSDAENLPKDVENRFKLYLNYLFPPPLPA